MIPEDFLHYIWQHKLFYTQGLTTTDNENVEVIDTGIRNTNAGPDFFNAKIKIDNKTWAGNVEIHLQSSDWIRHGHDKNAAYDSVILHIVKKSDTILTRKNGEKIPQIILQYPQGIEKKYSHFIETKNALPCANDLQKIPNFFISSWMHTLLTARLERKTQHIECLLEKNKNNWEETFYRVLAKSFGANLNGDAFEELANSLPLSCLQKHKNNLFQIEALLFGQANLLNRNNDEYAEKLKKEYLFLQTKFSLTPIKHSEWKMLRLRPMNFPHIRIAQFAGLIHQSSKLFSKIIEKPDYKTIKTLFTIKTLEYWDTHYTFKNTSAKRSKSMGENTINTLIINTIVPFIFVYGKKTNDEILQEKALNILEEIPGEKNNIISTWENMGVKCKNAYDTQALIELNNNYCIEKKCLRCRIAHKVLSKETEQK
jgi:hypothetical protein